MTKFGKIVSVVAGIALVGTVIFFLQLPPKVQENVVVDAPKPPYDQSFLEGNADDLLYLSIVPNAKVPNGILSYRGNIKGGYFFEGNILINILDKNKKNVLKASNAVAKGNWMTDGPVNFEGNIDFSGLPPGPAYFEIHNDNASGLKENNKHVLIPIVISEPEPSSFDTMLPVSETESSVGSGTTEGIINSLDNIAN